MAASVIASLAAVLIGAAAYLLIRSRRRPAVAPSGPTVSDDGVAEVTLPVDDADPALPATARLVADAVARAFARDARIETVVVRSRKGRELGRVQRHREQPAAPLVDVPLALREPHAPTHPGPREPVGRGRVAHAPEHVRFQDAPPPLPHRSLAEHLELDDVVRSRITDDEDAVTIVRAILESSGSPIDVEGNAFRRGDRMVIVLRTPVHAGVEAEALNGAYLRFQGGRAKKGIVLTAGMLHLADVRRRESLAPQLRHAGIDGIQRMADALAIGADPLDFVVAPD